MPKGGIDILIDKRIVDRVRPLLHRPIKAAPYERGWVLHMTDAAMCSCRQFCFDVFALEGKGMPSKRQRGKLSIG